MKVTEDKAKHRQLPKEGHPWKVSAEQRGYVEACTCKRITENTDIIANLQMTGLMEQILHRDNLNRAYKRVKSNKGSGGVDEMRVEDLLPYLREHGQELNQQIMDGRYHPNPVRRVQIPEYPQWSIEYTNKRLLKYYLQFLKNSFPETVLDFVQTEVLRML